MKSSGILFIWCVFLFIKNAESVPLNQNSGSKQKNQYSKSPNQNTNTNTAKKIIDASNYQQIKKATVDDDEDNDEDNNSLINKAIKFISDNAFSASLIAFYAFLNRAEIYTKVKNFFSLFFKNSSTNSKDEALLNEMKKKLSVFGPDNIQKILQESFQNVLRAKKDNPNKLIKLHKKINDDFDIVLKSINIINTHDKKEAMDKVTMEKAEEELMKIKTDLQGKIKTQLLTLIKNKFNNDDDQKALSVDEINNKLLEFKLPKEKIIEKQANTTVVKHAEVLVKKLVE